MLRIIRLVFICQFLITIVCLSCNNGKQNTNTTSAENIENNQVLDNKHCYTIAFYNVENLFDTENDPNSDDDEFTPSGKLNWNTERFQKKLKNISKVISSINNSPDIIGMAEIENTYVLEQLVKQEKIKGDKYKIVHYDGNDKRGIDVALLYKEKSFTLVDSKSINVEGMNNTRDILYVKGKTNNSETINIIVVHAPSRREGTDESENKRIKVSNTVKNIINDIVKEDKDAKIIVMGDFNDEPNNKSVKIIDNIKNNTFEMVNLMENKFNKISIGTAKHKDDWLIFDQIIVSNNLIDNNTNVLNAASVNIFNPQWIMFTNKKTREESPNRTYVGKKFVGGYSDHLPVYVSFQCK